MKPPYQYRIYASRYIGYLGGGVIIIAATSQMQALAIAAEKSSHSHLFKQYRDSIDDYIHMPDYNRVTPFEEVPDLMPTVKKAKIIFDSIYTER